MMRYLDKLEYPKAIVAGYKLLSNPALIAAARSCGLELFALLMETEQTVSVSSNGVLVVRAISLKSGLSTVVGEVGRPSAVWFITAVDVSVLLGLEMGLGIVALTDDVYLRATLRKCGAHWGAKNTQELVTLLQCSKN